MRTKENNINREESNHIAWAGRLLSRVNTLILSANYTMQYKQQSILERETAYLVKVKAVF